MMSTTEQDKSSHKSRPRSRKADKRGQKGDQPQSRMLDHPDQDQIGTTAVSIDAVTTGEAAAAELASGEASASAEVPLICEAAAADAASIDPGAPVENRSVNVQTIANAYGNYARKSMLQTGSLVEKLLGARSLDKAIEAQTEFARQAYANLVAEPQNICELYSRFARQIVKSWGGFAMGTRSK